jgi:hypothetical protein
MMTKEFQEKFTYGYKRDKTSQRRTLMECFDVVLIVGWLDVQIVTHSSIQQNLSLIQTSNLHSF